ncbi:hypothetical protein CEXT_582521 [Caerostris extrusa]|uniref:Uncharacterized protein n=1 Tax=Caerostris extrusa TaxID=172846 RepID=A0AAV4N5Z2_CAEEX|nr:hypothetical protein CEXT_582521 [Caerostris extrusa]
MGLNDSVSESSSAIGFNTKPMALEESMERIHGITGTHHWYPWNARIHGIHGTRASMELPGLIYLISSMIRFLLRAD